MSERDRQLEREADLSGDGDVGLGAETGVGGTIEDDTGVAGDLEGVTTLGESQGRPDSGSGGLRSQVGERARTVATVRSLAVGLAVVAASAFLVGGVLPFDLLDNLLGVALGGFLYGVAASTRHYTETALAGTAVGGALALLGNLALSLTGIGVPLVAVGAIGGGLAGLVGHYFGRDLRDGLTREI